MGGGAGSALGRGLGRGGWGGVVEFAAGAGGVGCGGWVMLAVLVVLVVWIALGGVIAGCAEVGGLSGFSGR